MRANVTNNSPAPQGVWTVEDGLQFVQPGQTRPLDIAADYVKRAKSLSFLSVEQIDKDEKKAPAGDASDLAAAIDMLDAGNDAHWTNAGLPAVDAVKEILGRDVTRAEINAAAPDFMRPTA